LFDAVIHAHKDLSTFHDKGRMLDPVKICSNRIKMQNSYCSAEIVIIGVMNLYLKYQRSCICWWFIL